MKIFNFFKCENQIDTSYSYCGITKYIPLLICGGFYVITILLFSFGPFDWSVSNKLYLYSFLGFTVIALFLGYFISTKIRFKSLESNYNINKIILYSFIMFFIIYILTTYSTTGKIYPDIVRGLFDSGTAYRISHSSFSAFSTILSYISIVTAPLTSFLLPLFFIYYKNLSKSSRILGFICLILTLFLGIAQGVINSCAVFSFQIILFVVIYIFSNLKKENWKGNICLIAVTIGLLVSFLLYYKVVMSNRLISDAKVDNEITDQQTDNKTANEKIDSELVNDILEASSTFKFAKLKDHHVFSFLPDTIESGFNHLVSYISHGYKGLSLAMEKDFSSSYGLGFSDFFRHNILKIFNKTKDENKYYKRTYMAKIEKDAWNTGEVWSTFFIYPASDIGFPFTIILVFVIGFIFGLSWRDTLTSKNIFSSVIFYNLCLMVCFFCANNLLFQNGGTFLTMFFMSIFWFLSRKLSKVK